MFDLVPFNRRMREIEKMFDKMVSDNFLNITSLNDIRVDIKENDNEYLLEAEIPGVEKEQIEIKYNNNYLTISVERKDEIKEEKENYIRRERRMGKTSRSFYVDGVDEDKIKAKYNNGILKITLPKSKNNRKGRSIDIQ
ncbi:Hsp20/alpha crystallin family protein [Thermohalobacter berrensis]|uniref:SHSP domain-containing protein n=1 Tax=Thermohalobacter berrensis TaxID=99594 RepID=A0A419TB83_9FIRM|nr:Hsp20/alpha crystallin family protein [Thermohalobacter berrensis]RKD34712.1 hypothetical protein BET03_02485 [Thermohalobacter berrensis]